MIDLNRVVLDLEPMLRRLIGEDIDLEVVTDRRPGAVKADPGQIEQVIMNLAVNARDAMPQGGRLTIEDRATSILTRSCHTRFGLAPPGAYVMLVVQRHRRAAWTRRRRPTSSSRSSPPRNRARAPAWACPPSMASSSRAAVTSMDSAARGRQHLHHLFAPPEAIVEPPEASPLTASSGGSETILLVEDEDVLRGLLAKFLRLMATRCWRPATAARPWSCERHRGRSTCW